MHMKRSARFATRGRGVKFRLRGMRLLTPGVLMMLSLIKPGKRFDTI